MMVGTIFLEQAASTQQSWHDVHTVFLLMRQYRDKILILSDSVNNEKLTCQQN